jgi:hypothetical protein
MNAILMPKSLVVHACECPASPGVYRLYRGQQLLHIGMAAGGATLHSEIVSHGRGDYGPRTQAADRVEWEVMPDAVLAYQRFLALYSALTYTAEDAEPANDAMPSASGRYSQPLTTSRHGDAAGSASLHSVPVTLDKET